MSGCEKLKPLRCFIALYIIVILSACTVIIITGRNNHIEDCSAINIDAKKEVAIERPQSDTE